MKPNLENKITKLIQQNQLQSITVDVFDTILNYDYWPSGLRYFDLAVQWTPYFQKYINPTLSSTEIYEWLTHAERALNENLLSNRIDILVDVITESICNKYHTEIREEDKIDFYANLMSTEITFELKNAKPNLSLAQQLRSIKKSYPNIKIYYVARTHLVTDQVRVLLALHDLSDIFDDGISSSELTPVLTHEELYAQLPKVFGSSFSLAHNLHIGDQRHPDFLVPRQHHSLAIHYRPIRFRGLRTLVGQVCLSIINQSIYLREHLRIQPKTNDIWRHYGRLLGEADQIQCQNLLQLAKQNPNTTYLIASDCAHLVENQPNLPANLQINPYLDETTLIKAFAWLLATYESDRWDAASLLKTLATYTKLNRPDLYKLCFKNYNFSLLAINSFSDENFWSHFLLEVRQADSAYTANLRNAYNYTLTLFSGNAQPIAIVQTHPDHTTELLQNFFQLFNLNPNISSCPLNYRKNIQELSDKIPSAHIQQHQKSLSEGTIDSIKSIQQTKLPLELYYAKVLLPEFIRTVKKLSHA